MPHASDKEKQAEIAKRLQSLRELFKSKWFFEFEYEELSREWWWWCFKSSEVDRAVCQTLAPPPSGTE